MRTAILPFLFIFNTQLLLIGVNSVWAFTLTFSSALLAMLVFASATQGFFLTRTKWYETLAMLLVCFTLFRPGYWLDQLASPYTVVSGASMAATLENAPPQSSQRIWVKGLTLEGRDVHKGVLLPMGPAAPLRERMAFSGLTTMADGDSLLVLAAGFGSAAERLGIEQGFRIESIEVPNDRPAAQWFFIPALGLLLLVVVAQRRRLRLEKPVVA
jgi:hypothetical protein